MAASVQAAIVEVLTEKTIRAAKKYKVKMIVVGGGVIANESLRSSLAARVSDDLPKVSLRLPQRKYTTDNAVMIAAAGYFHIASLSSSRRRGSTAVIPWNKAKADPNWELV
jgi:N6-L-threonylcarbamoyladenine synthase